MSDRPNVAGPFIAQCGRGHVYLLQTNRVDLGLYRWSEKRLTASAISTLTRVEDGAFAAEAAADIATMAKRCIIIMNHPPGTAPTEES